MGTSTLHLNNPVPSNGAVAASLGGKHTVTATLSGVGAISCKVQAWASSDNTDSKMLGAPVVISGTTTVSQTLTFNALDVTQFWLAVVEITPACTFTATVENSGGVQFGGAVIPYQQVPVLPKLSAALGNVIAQIADAEINVIGDSWTYGYYGTGTAAMPLARTLKSLLPSAYNPAIGWVALGSTTTNRDPANWTLGAGWTTQATMGFGAYSGVNANNPAGAAVFAAEDVCDTFDVMFIGVTGYGTAQIQATGGVAVPVVLNVAPAQVVIGTCSAAALQAGNTVTITGTGQMVLIACRARNSTKKQLYVNNLGVGSSLTAGWAAASSGYASRDCLAKTAPCLSIMQLGMNEAITNVAATTYMTSLRAAIAANPAGGELILASPGRCNPAANSGTALARLNEYRPLVQGLAAELGVRLVDVPGIVGEYAAATFADSFHLKREGYPKVAIAYNRTMFL